MIKMTQSIKRRIEKEVGRFDIFALMSLLKYYGYNSKDIRLVGHPGLESQPRFIKSIEFIDNYIVLTLYFGLGGANGVLPSYFLKMVDCEVIDEKHFSELIQFFDQYILGTWLEGMMPEKHIQSLGQHRWLRSAQNFRSLSSLNWLFGVVFPEHQIRVSRIRVNLSLSNRPAVIGRSKVGLEMILGDKMPVLAYSYKVMLISDLENNTKDVPWHLVIRQRVSKYILPVLNGLDLHLDIWMAVRTTRSWVRLLDEGNYIGYDRLKGRENDFKKIMIYSGFIDNFIASQP